MTTASSRVDLLLISDGHALLLCGFGHERVGRIASYKV